MNEGTKIRMLDVQLTFMPMSVHPVVITDGDSATLVDTAYPGQFPAFLRALAAAGVNPADIKRVVLTHQDLDHIGVMRELMEACGEGLEVYAHLFEKQYIEGARPYLKITPERIATRLKAVPEERRSAVAEMYGAVPNFAVTHTLNDGDRLPFHGGIQVIHTPGHTPGHLSLFLEEDRALIPGDELRVENSCLVGPSVEHTLEMPEALQSMQKLFGLEIDHVYSFHGGYCTGGIPERIREIARN